MNPERDRVTKMQIRFDFSINMVNSFRRYVRMRARRDRYWRITSMHTSLLRRLRRGPPIAIAGLGSRELSRGWMTGPVEEVQPAPAGSR
jgi:hypothetical protein